MMNAVMAFCVSLLVVCAMIFVQQMATSGYTDGVWFAAFMIVATAVMIGIVAAIPVFLVWLPLSHLLRAMQITPRRAAVLAAAPAAAIGALATSYVSREFTGGFGKASGIPGAFEICLFAGVAMFVTYLTWTLNPQKAEPE